MSDMSMLINGLKVTAEKGATFERRNPLDGSVATRAPAASPADAVMAVEAAAEANEADASGRDLAGFAIIDGDRIDRRPAARAIQHGADAVAVPRDHTRQRGHEARLVLLFLGVKACVLK